MRLLVVIGLILCLFGCGEKHGRFELCALKNGRFEGPSVMDTEHRRIGGSDTSYEFNIVNLPFARGFLKPFPLLLPVVPISQLPAHWETNGYEFTVAAPGAGADRWVLIDGQAKDPRADTSVVAHSSVLFSSAHGVIALKMYGSGANPAAPESRDVFPCGTAQIDGNSFGSAVPDKSP